MNRSNFDRITVSGKKIKRNILWLNILDLILGYKMKIEYKIQGSIPKFGIENWLKEVEPKRTKAKSKWIDDIHNHYFELVNEFQEFLHCSDPIVDNQNQQLKPIDIYNAVDYYRIRIEKLLLIINLKLYKTHNVNKETQVRYIVMRAFWIDEKGKPYRYFSKNVGAENKVLVNGKIPTKILGSIEDYIQTLMWDQYYFEYINSSEVGVDETGHIVIPKK